MVRSMPYLGGELFFGLSAPVEDALDVAPLLAGDARAAGDLGARCPLAVWMSLSGSTHDQPRNCQAVRLELVGLDDRQRRAVGEHDSSVEQRPAQPVVEDRLEPPRRTSGAASSTRRAQTARPRGCYAAGRKKRTDKLLVKRIRFVYLLKTRAMDFYRFYGKL